MKLSTLILLVSAAVVGVVVYFVEVRSSKSADEVTEKATPAFKIKREDVASITLHRGGQTINLENQDPDTKEMDFVPNQARQASLDYALSNSFGFGGTNGALVFKRWS